MAALAQSAVTINRAWVEGGLAGKDVRCRQVTLVLTGQGTIANPIAASLFNLTKIEQCSNAINDADTVIYPCVPSYDGTKLLFNSLVQATDANRALPADITATVRLIVKGY